MRFIKPLMLVVLTIGPAGAVVAGETPSLRLVRARDGSRVSIDGRPWIRLTTSPQAVSLNRLKIPPIEPLESSSVGPSYPSLTSIHAPGGEPRRPWAVPPAQKGWPVPLSRGEKTGVYASAIYADLDSDGDIEIIQGSYDSKVYAWHHDGTLVSGWPFTTKSYVMSTPACGDMDNDGHVEVVVNSNDGFLYMLDEGARVVRGWPKLVDDQYPHEGGAHMQSAAVLADLDGDSHLDVVYNSQKYGQTFAFDHEGRNVQGWPRKYGKREFNPATPAVGDLDGDGHVEVVVAVMYTSDDGLKNYNRIYVRRSDGALAKGWPVTLEKYWWSFFESVVLGDLDGDQDLEVIAKDLTKLYCLDKNGVRQKGWPVQLPEITDFLDDRLALANFDQDPAPEIVVGHPYAVYLLDQDGSTFDGFPVYQKCPGGFAVADLNGDGSNDIVSANAYPSRYLMAWNGRGKGLPYFPLKPRGYVDYAGPIALDVDGDGDVEVGIGNVPDSDLACLFYLWDLPSRIDHSKIDWPMSRRDTFNSGRYQAPGQVRGPSLAGTETRGARGK
ncbi:MAG: VCBS repeat-containing protein [Acidobacteriota bacterium]